MHCIDSESVEEMKNSALTSQYNHESQSGGFETVVTRTAAYLTPAPFVGYTRQARHYCQSEEAQKRCRCVECEGG